MARGAHLTEGAYGLGACLQWHVMCSLGFSSSCVGGAFERGFVMVTAMLDALAGEPASVSQYAFAVSALRVVAYAEGSALYDALGCVPVSNSSK